jgi:hypothetical protein
MIEQGKYERMTTFLPVKVPAWLGADLERLAQKDAELEGTRPNLSAIVRKALVAYVKARQDELEAL